MFVSNARNLTRLANETDSYLGKKYIQMKTNIHVWSCSLWIILSNILSSNNVIYFPNNLFWKQFYFSHHHILILKSSSITWNTTMFISGFIWWRRRIQHSILRGRDNRQGNRNWRRRRWFACGHLKYTHRSINFLNSAISPSTWDASSMQHLQQAHH